MATRARRQAYRTSPASLTEDGPRPRGQRQASRAAVMGTLVAAPYGHVRLTQAVRVMPQLVAAVPGRAVGAAGRTAVRAAGD